MIRTGAVHDANVGWGVYAGGAGGFATWWREAVGILRRVQGAVRGILIRSDAEELECGQKKCPNCRGEPGGLFS